MLIPSAYANPGMHLVDVKDRRRWCFVMIAKILFFIILNEYSSALSVSQSNIGFLKQDYRSMTRFQVAIWSSTRNIPDGYSVSSSNDKYDILTIRDRNSFSMIGFSEEVISKSSLEEISTMVLSLGTQRRHEKSSDLSDMITRILNKLDKLLVESEMYSEIRPVDELKTASDLLRLIVGLSKLRSTWMQFPLSLRSKYLQLILMFDNNQQVKDLATLLYSLGQVGFKIDNSDQDDNSTRQSIFNGMNTILNRCTGQSLSNMLHGIANIGIKWSNIPLSLQANMLQVIEGMIPSLRIDELCSTVQSLANMKVCYKYFARNASVSWIWY